MKDNSSILFKYWFNENGRGSANKRRSLVGQTKLTVETERDKYFKPDFGLKYSLDRKRTTETVPFPYNINTLRFLFGINIFGQDKNRVKNRFNNF